MNKTKENKEKKNNKKNHKMFVFRSTHRKLLLTFVRHFAAFNWVSPGLKQLPTMSSYVFTSVHHEEVTRIPHSTQVRAFCAHLRAHTGAYVKKNIHNCRDFNINAEFINGAINVFPRHNHLIVTILIDFIHWTFCLANVINCSKSW